MSKDMVYEDVPILNRRQGDNVVAGQNNATILLGRDRVTSVDTGYGARENGGGMSAGSIHVIAGRRSSDPSIRDDASTLYLSQRSDPDDQAGTDGIGSKLSEMSSAILRADCVRIVPRNDLKVSVGKAYLTMTSDGKVVVEGDIQLGEGAAQRILRGDAFAQYWSGPGHTHPTPVGMSGPPQPLPPTLLSPTVKVP